MSVVATLQADGVVDQFPMSGVLVYTRDVLLGEQEHKCTYVLVRREQLLLVRRPRHQRPLELRVRGCQYHGTVREEVTLP